ncbi:hypothetical protein GCM10010532_081610 [Dactylosporangium siamense]|uniref:DUF3995 domain-containing protein n=1 Tax=Dactylosporangium siamense TaxID=685454 RepID=A0A919PT59_9ACTN|nr:hypothetical protein Dsi01nite_060340 [Dactylosporangium siamense]
MAAGWSAASAVAGLTWAIGGPGFPFGGGDRATRMGAVLTGLQPGPAGAGIVALGLAGIVVALVLPHRPRLRVVGWLTAAVLLLVVPDGRLLLAVGELLVGHGERVEAAAVGQAWCSVGGVLWAGAARATGRRNSRPGDPAWARRVTLAAAACPLAYAAPRTLWAAGLTFGIDPATTAMVSTPTGRTRELVFAAAAVSGGLLTLGLIQPWGTQLPAWLPLLRGRRVPRWLATVPATAVAVVLTGAGVTMWRALTAAALTESAGDIAFDRANWAAWAGNLIWLPWGVTLGLATWAYHRRRATLAPAGPPRHNRSEPGLGQRRSM